MLTARLTGRAIVAPALLAIPAAAAAHGAGRLDADRPLWTLWQFPPEIVLGLLFAGWLYGRGIAAGAAGGPWRRIAFYAGVVALALALMSPVDALADRVFVMHQIEHMLLRTIGPMLILLSCPQAALMRGLPEWLRRRAVQPVVRSAGVRRVFGFLARPAVATLLFLGTSYFWMWPSWHDAAILNAPLHYVWHFSLLLSGLLFFAVLFDPRAAPAGPGLAARLMMFWCAAMGNILLGAFLSFKSEQLYRAYDVAGRLWFDPASDERIGGLTMWIPGTMMFAIAALVVLHRWAVDEGRSDARRVRLGTANAHETAVRARSERSNRLLGIGLASFAALVLVLATGVAILYERELSPSASHADLPAAAAQSPAV